MWSNPNVVACLAGIFFIGLWILTRKPERLSAIVFTGLLINLIFVILFFHPEFQNIVIGKDIAAQVICFTMFLLWISHLFRKNGFTVAPSPMNISVLVYFLAGCLSAFLAPRWSWYYSLEEIARTAASILMFFMAVKFLNTRSRWNLGLHVLLICMAVTCVYAFLQIKGFDVVEWGRIVNVSTFGNKDFFAAFLTYTTPIAFFMAAGSRNLFDAAIYFALFLLGMYHIIDGETRGAWLGLLALGCVTVWFELKHGRIRQKLGSLQKVVIAGVVMIAVLAAASAFAPQRKIDAFKSIFQTHKGTNIIRVYIWWTSMRMWVDNPVVGQGIGTYQLTYPAFRPDRYNRIGMSHNTRHAHSEEMEILAEQGMLGFAAWLAMMVIFFYFSLKKIKAIPDMKDRYLYFGLVGGLIAGLVHDSINVNLRWTSSAVVFWFLMALVTRYTLGFDPEPDKKHHPGHGFRRREVPLGVGLTAIFIFMFSIEYRIIRADHLLRIVEGTVENPSTQRLGIETGKEILQLVPYDHSALYKSAYACLYQNEYPQANDMYRRLLSLAPNYAQVHQNTAMLAYRAYLTTHEKKYLYQAVLELEWATGLENNFVNHAKMIQFYVQGMDDTARALYHNQFLLWNSMEDSFFAWSRYRTVAATPGQDEKTLKIVFGEWVKPVIDFRSDYWLYRAESSRRLGRSVDEVKYARRMASRVVPNDRMREDIARP